MFGVNAVSRAISTVRTSGSKRGIAFYTDIVASPPQVKVSLTEKMVHFGLLSIGFLGYPVYTLFQVAAIKQAEYDTLEIPEMWQDFKEE